MIGRKVLAALALGLGVLFVAGCQDSVTRTDYDSLKKHDQALQDENAAMRTEQQKFADQQAQGERQRQAALDAQKTAAAPTTTSTSPNMSNVAAQLPKGAELTQRDGKPVIRIEGSLVNFGSGKASLSPDGKVAMDKVALILNREFAGQPIIVEGHTDSDPINRTKNLYKSNWELGMKRATEVVDYLELKGVDPKRIRATSYGENQPISQDKSKNRRVEIVVLPADGAISSPTASLGN